jgi:hypothetical protein
VSTYNFDVIFTVEARSNILLEGITKQFNLNENRVFHEIQSSFKQLKSALIKKNINYADLKRALVPNVDKNELVFVFDWSNIESRWYGREIIDWMLPLFDKRSTHSVLRGDWIYRSEHNNWLCDELANSLMGSSGRYEGKGGELYFVYVNNLSDSMARHFDQELRAHPAYLGYLDLRFMSPIKAYLSTLLIPAFIKHKGIIIQSHEDDRSEAEDVNLLNYNFENFGYIVRSIPSWLYGIFLSYKIERPIIEQNDSDTRFSLNAISHQPMELDRFTIELDERKLEYLQKKKGGSLKRADFSSLSAAEIADQIRKKIKANYIYNLARSIDGDTMKFNIIIENKGLVRNECALEYRPADGLLRLITFY